MGEGEIITEHSSKVVTTKSERKPLTIKETKAVEKQFPHRGAKKAESIREQTQATVQKFKPQSEAALRAQGFSDFAIERWKEQIEAGAKVKLIRFKNNGPQGGYIERVDPWITEDVESETEDRKAA